MAHRLLVLATVVLTVSANSWQNYVDEQFVGSGRLTKGAILSLGGEFNGKSADLDMTTEEAKQFVELLNNPSFDSRPSIEGKKYNIIETHPYVFGKSGSAGFIAQKTNTVIVLGLYGQTQQPGNAAIAVTELAAYLRDTGY